MLRGRRGGLQCSRGGGGQVSGGGGRPGGSVRGGGAAGGENRALGPPCPLGLRRPGAPGAFFPGATPRAQAVRDLPKAPARDLGGFRPAGSGRPPSGSHPSEDALVASAAPHLTRAGLSTRDRERPPQVTLSPLPTINAFCLWTLGSHGCALLHRCWAVLSPSFLTYEMGRVAEEACPHVGWLVRAPRVHARCCGRR